MKKSAAMLMAAMGMAAIAASGMAAEPDYIPWTFDDFDSNCEVIETAEAQALELPVPAVERIEDEEAGELGW